MPIAMSAGWALERHEFEGALVYPGVREVPVPEDSLDGASIGRVAELVRRLTSDDPAAGCRWCDLTRSHCLDRVDLEVT